MAGKPHNGRKRALTPAQRKRNQRARNKAQALVMRRSERLMAMQAKAEAQSAEVAASNAAFAASPYAHKRFACGIVDVPLDFEARSDKGRSRAPGYRLLSPDAICEFDPPFARDAGMYFWAWRYATKECLRIVEAWGFRKASTLYWVKTRPDGSLGYLSTGYYGMANPVEELWVCRRGDYVAPMMGDGFESIAWHLPATSEHSAKPQAFYDAIARLHPGVELLDMFARMRRARWWAYGDQIEGLIQPPTDALEAQMILDQAAAD
jgi:N6-adenosine-specific RNA methylase IME4